MLRKKFSRINKPKAKFEIEELETRTMLSTVSIFAAGDTGDEQMQILIDGEVRQVYDSVGGDASSGNFEIFEYETPESLSADQISIRFSNDAYEPQSGYDRNLHIDKIVIDGTAYHSEHFANYVSNYWDDGLVSGNLQVETLNVAGQIDYSSASELKYNWIAIIASGQEGSEQMELVVDGETIGQTQVTTSSETYVFSVDSGFDLEQLQVHFTNDAVGSNGYDRNLTVDFVILGDSISNHRRQIETTQSSVLSTGTWRDSDGIVNGFGRGDTLHANGFFEFTGVEDRSIDGSGNNTTDELADAGSAHSELMRFNDYKPVYAGDGDGEDVINDGERANARDISNAVVRSDTLTQSSANLSDLVWVWGQFLDHDIDLSEQSDGAEINGTSVVTINDPSDPLNPVPITITRSDFETDEEGYRQQLNAITSFIDASNVYGSDLDRSNALRTFSGGRMVIGVDQLLPTDVDVANENGGITEIGLFAAGDVRANENVILASIHTIFVREHNRLADLISSHNPNHTDEEIFQLARKIVGAQMQIITYNEFLPALLGDAAPSAYGYEYDSTVDPSIANSFAHAGFRFGHSMLSPSLQLASSDGEVVGGIGLKDAFFNPSFLQEDASRVEQLLQGALLQRAQEIDVNIVEDVRSFLFGAPGAGGLDLASLNIQRGRDHGLPDYNTLRTIYGLAPVQSFADITSDFQLQQELAEVYGGDVNKIDPWVGGLAEDHAGNSNMGELFTEIIQSQFERLRDGDRLFYTSDDLGLYSNGQLRGDIRSIIDLDNFSLADVLTANSNISVDSDPFHVVPGQTLTVNAYSSTPDGEFQIVVGGEILATFHTSIQANSFSVNLPDAIPQESVQIHFTNDAYVANEYDRNLIVQSIQVGDAVYETNDDSVFSTGTWNIGDGIVSGFGRGDVLHANGYFEFLI